MSKLLEVKQVSPIFFNGVMRLTCYMSDGSQWSCDTKGNNWKKEHPGEAELTELFQKRAELTELFQKREVE